MAANAKFELQAVLRQDQGKGASRRLRRTQDKIPAIIYGGGEPPQMIALDQKKVMHALDDKGFYSHILNLEIEGQKHQAVLKAMQRHHFKKSIMHMDFLRINPNELIYMHIPIRFIGEQVAPGVKAGGIVNHHLIDIEVRCLPSALPEYFEVDVSNLALDESIHLSQLKLPPNVELEAFAHGRKEEHDEAIVSIHLPRRVVEEEVVVPPPETAVIAKGKEAKEGTDAKTQAANKAAPAPAKDSKDKGKGK